MALAVGGIGLSVGAIVGGGLGVLVGGGTGVLVGGGTGVLVGLCVLVGRGVLVGGFVTFVGGMGPTFTVVDGRKTGLAVFVGVLVAVGVRVGVGVLRRYMVAVGASDIGNTTAVSTKVSVGIRMVSVVVGELPPWREKACQPMIAMEKMNKTASAILALQEYCCTVVSGSGCFSV